MSAATQVTEASAPTRVERRHVLYVGGFDPRGVKHAHALYKTEGAKQQMAGGPVIAVGRRTKDGVGNSTWNIEADLPDGPVHSRLTYLGWDDIVRQHWPMGRLQLWADIVRTNIVNLRHGVFRKMLRAAYPPVIAMVTPMLIVLMTALATFALLGMAVIAGNRLQWHWSAIATMVVAALTLLLLGASLLARRFSMFWVSRSFAFNARLALGQVPEWQPMVQAHARTLVDAVQALQGHYDAEVLLVGHSSGSILAASILAEALRLDPALTQRGPAVSFMTLGHCIPMLGCFPQADALRDDLAMLGRIAGLTWVDFTAPADGSCFALSNPLWACEVPGTPLPDRPKLLSPRFAEMFDPATYAALRADRLKLHFQYLMATERPVNYDYFHITAGSLTLGARFAPFASVDNYTRFRIPRR